MPIYLSCVEPILVLDCHLYSSFYISVALLLVSIKRLSAQRESTGVYESAAFLIKAMPVVHYLGRNFFLLIVSAAMLGGLKGGGGRGRGGNIKI